MRHFSGSPWAFSTVDSPLLGNDLGVLTAKIMGKLSDDGEIDVIDGFIYVNRDTGEFIIHGIDGSI